EGGRRELPDRSRLSPEAGVAGDAWGRRAKRTADTQITAMQADVAELIANGQLTLFGANLFLELDLSARNLPVGSRLRIGAPVLEVTPVPHNGCRKFQARFGQEALRFVSGKELRQRNLRGISAGGGARRRPTGIGKGAEARRISDRARVHGDPVDRHA
ncbi:MAG TPA: hypothetical protein VGC93_14100, partial [Thermoanaerobaculia bacterium]